MGSSGGGLACEPLLTDRKRAQQLGKRQFELHHLHLPTKKFGSVPDMLPNAVTIATVERKLGLPLSAACDTLNTRSWSSA